MIDSFIIDIKADWLKRQYSVYAIQITYQGKDYLYIGQTGDNHHVTARSAFSRLGAHVMDRSYSTENQLYRAVAKEICQFDLKKGEKFSPDLKEKVEQVFIQAKIRMHVFPQFKFESGKNHDQKRRTVLSIEQSLIALFDQNQTKYRVLNLKKSKKQGQFIMHEDAEAIFKKFIV